MFFDIFCCKAYNVFKNRRFHLHKRLSGCRRKRAQELFVESIGRFVRLACKWTLVRDSMSDILGIAKSGSRCGNTTLGNGEL